MDTQMLMNRKEGEDLMVSNELQSFSEELLKEAEGVLKAYLMDHRNELKSERDIFGTITIEVVPRYVSPITAILSERGATLKEMICEKPIRRNSMVKLVYESNRMGIIHEFEERKSCG